MTPVAVVQVYGMRIDVHEGGMSVLFDRDGKEVGVYPSVREALDVAGRTTGPV